MYQNNLHEYIWDSYVKFMADADPRVEDWFGLSSPTSCLVLTFLYFVVALSSPKLMEDKQPMDIKNVIVGYNICMVLLSGYNFYEILSSGWLSGYSLGCQMVDYSDSPQALRMARACWIFYLSKNIELLDTIFFILRKKTSHISWLHVMHHGLLPLSVWYGAKFTPGGLASFFVLFNTFVHCIMYTYYTMAALGGPTGKHLALKKYVTRLQMLQFVGMSIHSIQFLFIDCKFDKIVKSFLIFYPIFFLVLFINFYRKAYQTRKPPGIVNGSNLNHQKDK